MKRLYRKIKDKITGAAVGWSVTAVFLWMTGKTLKQIFYGTIVAWVFWIVTIIYCRYKGYIT